MQSTLPFLVPDHGPGTAQACVDHKGAQGSVLPSGEPKTHPETRTQNQKVKATRDMNEDQQGCKAVTILGEKMWKRLWEEDGIKQ